ncbi:hypothetical protein S83_067151 [Arachis hypogaea]
MQKYATQPHKQDPIVVRNGLLFWKERLYIPTPLVPRILHEFHNSPTGGHSEIAKTTSRITSQFYWPHMHKDIKDFVRHCMICQQAKSENTLPGGLLQPLPIPQQI